MQALVIRGLLLQEAVKQGLCDQDGALSQPDETIEKLLVSEIKVARPDEALCDCYFNPCGSNSPQLAANKLKYSQCEASESNLIPRFTK